MTGSQQARVPIWYDYRSWYAAAENTLYEDAERHIVEHVRWITDAIIEIRFYGISANYLLSPLAPVAERERADEIRPNNATILLGQYIVVVEPGEEGQSSQNREAVTN
jgi:hypothetical protein